MKTPSFQALGHTLTVKYEKYANNGRLAVQLFDEKDPCTTLSCNLPEEDLADGEFFVKNWSENEEIAICAFRSGLFIDTGKRSNDSLFAPIWCIATSEEPTVETTTPADETLLRLISEGQFSDMIVDEACGKFASTLVSVPEEVLDIIPGKACPDPDNDVCYESMITTREQAVFVLRRLGELLA